MRHCISWRVVFVFFFFGGQNCRCDDSLGPWEHNHLTSTLSPRRFVLRQLVDGKIHGLATVIAVR
jgi:hypothetical protein